MSENLFIGYVVIGLLFILITVIMGLWLIRKLFKTFKLNTVFGVDAKSRLIGLGVAVIFFPTVLPQIIGALISMFTTIIRNGSSILFENVGNNITNCRDDNLTVCLGQIGMNFLQTFSIALNNALQSLNQIPINRLILLLCVWAFTGYLLDQAQSGPDNGDDKGKNQWIKQIFYNRKSVTIKNMVFFLILIVGAYLSVAAIAAIPQLQEKTVMYQEIGVEKLKLQLESAYSLFDKKYPAEVGSKESFAKLDEFLKSVEPYDEYESEINDSNTSKPPAPPAQTSVKANTNSADTAAANRNANTNTTADTNTANTANASNTANVNANKAPDANEPKPTLTTAASKVRLPKYLFQSITYIGSQGKQGYERAIQNYKSLLATVKETQRTAKDSATQNYETSSLIGKGNKERVKYFLEITESFNQQSTALDQRLNVCLINIQEMDNAWKTFVDTLPSLTADRSSSEFITRQATETLYDKNFTAQRNCEPYSLPTSQMPQRPLLGEASELGIFGFVAGWLLRTESLSLALITGLIGFGLLGSACSTFIRERLSETGNVDTRKAKLKKPDGLLVSDLTAVIIRGVSAAIVIFLAVEGGLAIFASGEGEPNPYVLLFTCLVAAVFSETVWSWAEKQLNDRLNKEKPNNEAENTDEEPAEKCKCGKPADTTETPAEETGSAQQEENEEPAKKDEKQVKEEAESVEKDEKPDQEPK